MSESGPDSPPDAQTAGPPHEVRRFKREDAEAVTLTDVSAQDAGDGSREWCFTVRGLDDSVQAARFATRREAERAHLRLRRAMELLGHQSSR